MLSMNSTRSNYVYTTNQPVTGKRQTHHPLNRDKQVTNGNEGAGSRRTHNGHISPKPTQNGSAKSEDSINFKTVERIDRRVLDIVRTVSCVVVYEYLEDSETWERTPIEGTLFIYSRDPATTPTHAHAFLILSKLTNENLVVYLEREMMIHTQPPFVLFKRTKADKVFGLNFTDESTCKEVGKELLTLCQNTRPVSPAQQRQEILTISNRRVHLTPSPSLSSGEGDSPEEAGSMSHGTSIHQRKVDAHKIRKASGRRTSEPINRTKRDSSPILIVKPNSKVNHRPGGHAHQTPPRSSGNNTRSRERGKQYHSNSFDVGQPSSSFPTVNLAKRLFHSATIDEASLKDTPPVLNELFASASSRTTTTPISNGVSTPPVKMVSVAEIERRMSTEVTPVTGSPVPSRHTLLHPSAFSNSTHFPGENVPPNGQSPCAQTGFDNRLEVNVVPPTPVASPGSKFPAIPFPVQSPGMRSQPIASDSPPPPPSSQLTGEYTDTVEPTNQITALPEVSMTTSSAALMSPQSFSGVNRSASEPTKPKSETTFGLTEQQLQQALIHLIKNDANFVSTLHEAYVDSLRSSTR